MSEDQLKAEVARLKTEVQHLMIFCNSTLIPSKELQDENARLKAEVERLKAFSDEAQAHIAKEERKSRERLDMAQQELARLRASSFVTAVPVEQYERLLKAGDAMQKSMLECGPNEMAEAFHHDDWWASYNAWNAAKEGKQS